MALGIGSRKLRKQIHQSRLCGQERLLPLLRAADCFYAGHDKPGVIEYRIRILRGCIISPHPAICVS